MNIRILLIAGLALVAAAVLVAIAVAADPDCTDRRCAYLPLVVGAGDANPAPTPSPEPTLPAAPSPTPDLPPLNGLRNGDFEAGPAGWEGSAAISANLPQLVVPHGGSYAAWLGANDGTLIRIAQEVTIPADRPFLSYWYRFDPGNTTCDDVVWLTWLAAGATVDQTVFVEGFRLCDSRALRDWLRRGADLRPFAGQTGTLAFELENLQQAPISSSLFLDDLALLSTEEITTGGVINGDFEWGLLGWAVASSGNLLVITPDLPIGVAPFAGFWAAWVAADVNQNQQIAQSVVVTAELPYLTYHYRIVSLEPDCDATDGDSLRVEVHDESGVVHTVDELALCEATSSFDWADRSVDLSAFAGQTVEVRFIGTTDNQDASNCFVDGITFTATAAP